MKPRALVYCLILFIWFLPVQPTKANPWQYEDLWGELFSNQCSIMLLVEGTDGQILKANQGAEGFYGYTVQELETMLFRELFVDYNQLAEHIGPDCFSGLHQLADGTTRSVKVQSSRSGDAGEFTFYIITDTTEEQLVNLRLFENMERLRRAEELVGLGSWQFILDEDRVLLSDGAQRILGWPSNEQTMQDTYDHTIPEDRELRLQALNALIEEGTPYDIQFRVKRASDGAIIDFRSMAEYDSETNLVFGTLHDITDIVSQNKAYSDLRRKITYGLVTLLFIQLMVIIQLVINIRQRKKAEQNLVHNLERNESLVRILQRPTETIQELLDYTLQESLNLTSSKIGYIYFYSEEREEFTLNTWSSNVMPQCKITEKQTVYQLSKTGIWGEAVRQGKPIIVNKFDDPHPLKKGYPPGHVPISKYMTVPIFDGEKIVAVVGLANRKTDYGDIDVWQVSLLMNSVWSMVERKRSQFALKEERERLRAILLSVGDGVIATDEKGYIEMINPVAQRLTGWMQADALGKPFEKVFNIINEQTRKKCPNPVTMVLNTGEIVGLANHTVLLTRDGGEIPIADSAAPIRNHHNQISGVVVVFRDVTDERKQMDEIKYLSRHDYLTGVYNRSYLEKQLQKLEDTGSFPFSIIITDLDGLRIANDTFGRSMGDKILRRAADIIRSHCRSEDIVARWGGDEFVILLPNAGEEVAETVGTRISSAFQGVKVDSIPISASFGWDTRLDLSRSTNEVFRKAENRMSRAKLFQSPGIRSEIIHVLMATLYEKNSREEQHCQRVSELSQLIGKGLGLSEGKIKELGIIGLFHDIGKVSIEERILNKTGDLTEEEWKAVKRHPQVGYRVLSNVQDMVEIADYVLAHHERWDGKGYPRGLKGQQIPLQSRLIAVADAYDAMVSFRPYKKSLTREEALAEIMRCSGTQFDPQIAKVFVKVMKDWNQVAPTRDDE